MQGLPPNAHKESELSSTLLEPADVKTPVLPPPAGHGWKVDESGNLDFRWTASNLMPDELVDILLETGDEAQEDDTPEVMNLIDFIFSD